MLNKSFHKGIAAVLSTAVAFSLFANCYGYQDVNADGIDVPVSEYILNPYEDKDFDMTVNTGVEGFVNRLYNVCLDRTPDKNGFNMWCNLLASGAYTGADAAEGFFYSEEFLNKDYSNENYLTYLYRVFFDREPDPEGWDVWMGLLESGTSRRDVMYGFIGSTEWANVCFSFGIKSGATTLPSKIEVTNENVKTFVNSLYSDCLDREADEDGFTTWYNLLVTKQTGGIQAAYGFFYSAEFQKKISTMDPEEIVAIFYKVFLNREASYWEIEDWVGYYDVYGMNILFNGFANSAEFATKCESYGIMVGEPADMPVVEVEEEFFRFARYEQFGIDNLNTATLSPHDSYVMFNTQGSETRVTEHKISQADWAAIEKFARTHFQESWTPGQKAAYTMFWIHYNVDYASSSAQWNSIGGLGYAQAIFEKQTGQCAQYNGAMCEMLCYLGFDANMIQGYRGSSSSSRYQHFWCEVNIDGNIYVIECGNKKDGDWWYFAVPYSYTRKFIKNGVVQG